MNNLKIIELLVTSSFTIEVKFSENISEKISKNNFYIKPYNSLYPIPKIFSIVVSENIVELFIQPLTPYVKYRLELIAPFLTSSGIANINYSNNFYDFLGYEDSSILIKENFVKYLEKNYDLTSPIMKDLLNSKSIILFDALNDIKELKNDNYLELLIENESKIRGNGPYDRLNEGGAFEVVKVTKNFPPKEIAETFYFEKFPYFPISLQSTEIEEIIDANINDFIFSVSKYPILNIKKILFIYNDNHEFEYSIDEYGYQIKNNLFDQEFASSYQLLKDNEIRINSNILKKTRLPFLNEKIKIVYCFKNLGKIINENSIEVFSKRKSIREVTPPIKNYFNLKNAPIINSNGDIGSIGDVIFLDPYSNPPFSEKHPAFLKEKKFDLNVLPASFGEFSVNYETGQVFVFGEDEKQTGTGNYPPVATYSYKQIFISDIDYTYDKEKYQIVASPIREMAGDEVYISFFYEQNLIPFVDFKPQVHQEILNERVENRINSNLSLNVKNIPITNVFRLYNETTGEVYTVNRWNDTTVYFSGNPPTLKNSFHETVKFANQYNESPNIVEEIFNSFGTKIFKIKTLYAPIVNSTEDGIGISYNTSLYFSNKELFIKEKYLDTQTDLITNQLENLIIGQYFIDYQNGYIYVAVDNDQNYDLGFINYKYGKIKTDNENIYNINNLYFNLNQSDGINKLVLINSFDKEFVIPSEFEISDERFFNKEKDQSYIVDNDNIVVNNNIFEVRGIYDLFDLKNNINPIDFSVGCSFVNKTISLTPIVLQIDYTITNAEIIEIDRPSEGIEIYEILSVIGKENYIEYWNQDCSFQEFNLFLNNNFPNIGENVIITLKYKLNGGATPIIDYSKGNYLIDYDYVSDQILISYEYGNNLLDFRENDFTIEPGENYFVTYKVGALRQALLNNFGSIFNINFLNQINFSLDREEYRDCLKAAFGMIGKGTTINSFKDLIKTIVHVEPNIIESIFECWSLGNSYLYPNNPKIFGNIEYVPGIFDNGILINKNDQCIELDLISSIRLENGTLEFWIIPEWNGLDNDAKLTFELYKNGEKLNENKIFIGNSSFNPVIKNGKFEIIKNDIICGIPNKIYTENGIFIYFDLNQNKWKMLAKESVNDSSVYSGKIFSSGKFYGVRHIENLGEASDFIRSQNSEIEFEFNLDSYDSENQDGYLGSDGYLSGYSFDGIEFMSDQHHYLIDAGQEKKNRFSIFKDGNGYLVFRIIDKFGNNREISSNISNWSSGEKHHIACSWSLNNADGRDEMHFFLDGKEVSNILKFGGLPPIVTGDKYRKIKPEIILMSADKYSLFGNDLITNIGSNIVESNSINFEDFGFVSGDNISILETGFDNYTILNVNGSFITLDQPMPATLENVRFSINPLQFIVSTHVGLYTNIILKILRNGEEIELPGQRALYPSYSISKNNLLQDVLTIYGDIYPQDQISLQTLGLNHKKVKEDIYLWNDSSILKINIPIPINLDEVKIFSLLLPLTSITNETATNIIGNTWTQQLSLTQPSNNIEGRYLKIKISSDNINYATPLSATIFGTLENGDLSETLIFTKNAEVKTENKFLSISYIELQFESFINDKPFLSIEISESDSIFTSQSNENYPVLRYSYIYQVGSSLESENNIVKDYDAIFNNDIVGNYIKIIDSPYNGIYKILEKIDENAIKLDTSFSSFSGINYEIYYIGKGKSAFQNGYFTLQNVNNLNPYILPRGLYRFEYATYLNMPFDPLVNEKFIIGNSINNQFPAGCIFDEIKSLSKKLSDLRIGELASSKEAYITKDASIFRTNKSRPNKDTLLLMNFEEEIKNEAFLYTNFQKDYLQSEDGINSEFNSCFYANYNGLSLNNDGILDKNEGCIEFWINPKFDTINDSNIRYYFDASSYFSEELISTSSSIININTKALKIIGVYLQKDVNNSGINYAENCQILNDKKTINLNKSLPNYKTPVKVYFIPQFLKGNRISIFKNKESYLVFQIISGDDIFERKIPIFWAQNTWHRVVANYKMNSSSSYLQLLVDGSESGMPMFGQGFIFGSEIIFGQNWSNSAPLQTEISFKDPINFIHIGSDFLNAKLAKAKIDNLKISNKINKLWKIGNQIQDFNYNSNIEQVKPVVEDLFTTYLSNFDNYLIKNDDFAILKNENFGISNFELQIIDSFGKLKNNSQLKEILETLIKLFKSSCSKVSIKYLS